MTNGTSEPGGVFWKLLARVVRRRTYFETWQSNPWLPYHISVEEVQKDWQPDLEKHLRTMLLLLYAPVLDTTLKQKWIDPSNPNSDKPLHVVRHYRDCFIVHGGEECGWLMGKEDKELEEVLRGLSLRIPGIELDSFDSVESLVEDIIGVLQKDGSRVK